MIYLKISWENSAYSEYQEKRIRADLFKDWNKIELPFHTSCLSEITNYNLKKTMSELSFHWLKESGYFSPFFDISSAKSSKPLQKSLRHLITSDPADHQGRQKQALEHQSIIDLRECIHTADSRPSFRTVSPDINKSRGKFRAHRHGKQHHLIDRSSMGKLIPPQPREEVFVYSLQTLIIFKLPDWSKGFG